ncbi:MAG: DNA primase [Candidatus Aminicenantes bacterium]|nr:DNA primase [Candidatus Aminicenantes bacterium]
MDVVEQIRQTASLLEIASQYTTLNKRGSKYVGLCPFHSERNPSFTLDPDKQLYHCFGCGAGGDVFALVMEKEGMSFPEAVKHLAERYRIPLPQRSDAAARAQKTEEKIFKINEDALAFFRRNLHATEEGKKALNYLKQRGLAEQTLETLRLGYAPESWTALADHFQARGVPPELLMKAGLVVPGRKKAGWFDRFRGRVMFPIFNLTGKTVAFGGRTLSGTETKYLNSPETPIYSKGRILYGLNFTKDAVRTQGALILVEGYTDFTGLFQSGIAHCAASLGTSLTAAQVSLARRFSPRLIINYDGDSAGRTAAARAVALCFEQGTDVSVVVLPADLDPDGYIRRHGREAYLALLDKSRSGLRFLFDAATGGRLPATPEAKAGILRSLLAAVDKMPDPIVKSEYVHQLSNLFGVDEEFVRSVLSPQDGTAAQEDAPFLYAEKRLLQILLHNPEFVPSVMDEILEGDFDSVGSRDIFSALCDLHHSSSPLNVQTLGARLNKGRVKHLSRILIEPSDPPTPEEALDCLFALRKIHLDERLRSLQAEIVDKEKKGNWDSVRKLISLRNDLTRQRMSL